MAKRPIDKVHVKEKYSKKKFYQGRIKATKNGIANISIPKNKQISHRLVRAKLKKETRKEVVAAELPTRVEIIESERGWGQRTDEIKTFKKRELAEAFVKKYNEKNNLPTVPDWYMYARIMEA